MGAWADMHARSLTDPDGFWGEAAQGIDWITPCETVCDTSGAPGTDWFAGGQLNTCANALDRHVAAGRGDQTAIIYDSAMLGAVQKITYAQLLARTEKIAGMLVADGVKKGDRVIIYMPMIPEAAMAMLACARIGAVHSVVFGGFASPELATRIDDAGADVILAASCGLEPGRTLAYKPLLDKAIELASHPVRSLFMWQREACPAEMSSDRDKDWAAAEEAAEPAAAVPVGATDPLYILYTSGTTGQPKGIVRQNGGHAVALHWSMPNIYGADAGDVYWAASDVGWVVGHSYIVYAPLLRGCTTVLFEGKPVGTPDPGTFWRVISDHRVKVMFTAPTAIRAIKQQDPQGEFAQKYDLSCLESLFLAGERCDPDTLHWSERVLGVPVIDHWWQTETGSPICSNFMGVEQMPVKAGSPTVPGPGWDMQVLDSDGQPVPPGTIGALAAKLPLPPGVFATIWNAHDRYIKSYMSEFPGYYASGDAGMIDEDGYIHVMARTDDVINVAGHRLSTGQMEEILCNHPDVAEAAVLGVADELKGQLPLGLLVLNAGVEKTAGDVSADVIASVRQEIGPVAAFKTALVVKRLPKTRSGKILRATIRAIADGQPWNMPATIDDPAILDEITDALKAAGYTGA